MWVLVVFCARFCTLSIHSCHVDKLIEYLTSIRNCNNCAVHIIVCRCSAIVDDMKIVREVAYVFGSAFCVGFLKRFYILIDWLMLLHLSLTLCLVNSLFLTFSFSTKTFPFRDLVRVINCMMSCLLGLINFVSEAISHWQRLVA